MGSSRWLFSVWFGAGGVWCLSGWLSVWLLGLFVCLGLLNLRIDTREIEAFIYYSVSVQVYTLDEDGADRHVGPASLAASTPLHDIL